MADAGEVIGVDGGGSGCRLALETAEGRISVTGGPANVFTDFEAAIAALDAGLASLERAAGRPLTEVPAHFALAGVTDDALAQRVAAALPLTLVSVAEDRWAVLAGALGDRDGTVAGIGTGSFLARRAAGTMRTLGGHGLTLGDEASGAWLGRGILGRALHAAEGLAAHSELTRALSAELGGIAGIVSLGRVSGPAQFAAFAPRVAAAAAAGDAHAVALMRSGAAYLARGARALGWRPGETFCLAGGVAPAYRGWLPPPVAASVRPPQGSALDGAIALARAFAAEERA